MIVMLALKTARIVVFAYGGSDMDSITNNQIEESIAKDDALRIAAKILTKLYHSDNGNAESMAANIFVLTAEADKDYGKMFHMLEELRKFIVKLQLALKQKE